MKHRNDPPLHTGSVAFPRGPRVDLFPAPPTAALTAVTVFTTFEVPRPASAGAYAPPSAAAVCACGDTWQHDSRVLLRRMLGSHSCAAEHGRVELVPIDDEPSDDVLARVLDGLRSL